jgi:hypothetical protein
VEEGVAKGVLAKPKASARDGAPPPTNKYSWGPSKWKGKAPPQNEMMVGG